MFTSAAHFCRSFSFVRYYGNQGCNLAWRKTLFSLTERNLSLLLNALRRRPPFRPSSPAFLPQFLRGELPAVISSPRDPKRHHRAVKQPHLSCSHQANVVDTSCSEIKANRVPARRHTTLFRQENRYANLRANPSNLARPSCSPCNDGSTGVCHLLSTTTTTTPSLFRSFPFLLSPPSQLRPIVLDFFLFASLFLFLPIP